MPITEKDLREALHVAAPTPTRGIAAAEVMRRAARLRWGRRAALTVVLVAIAGTSAITWQASQQSFQWASAAPQACPNTRPHIDWTVLQPGSGPAAPKPETVTAATICTYTPWTNSNMKLLASTQLSSTATTGVLKIVSAAEPAHGSRSCPRIHRPTYLLLLQGGDGEFASLVLVQDGCESLIRDDHIWEVFNLERVRRIIRQS